MQLAVHDETQIYEDSIRLEESNRELAAVNRRLQQMYERMADDVKEKESLNLKIQLHDALGRSLLTLQDVRNSSSLEVKEKLRNMREAVNILSGSRTDTVSSFAGEKERAARFAQCS